MSRPINELGAVIRDQMRRVEAPLNDEAAVARNRETLQAFFAQLELLNALPDLASVLEKCLRDRVHPPGIYFTTRLRLVGSQEVDVDAVVRLSSEKKAQEASIKLVEHRLVLSFWSPGESEDIVIRKDATSSIESWTKTEHLESVLIALLERLKKVTAPEA